MHDESVFVLFCLRPLRESGSWVVNAPENWVCNKKEPTESDTSMPVLSACAKSCANKERSYRVDFTTIEMPSSFRHAFFFIYFLFCLFFHFFVSVHRSMRSPNIILCSWLVFSLNFLHPFRTFNASKWSGSLATPYWIRIRVWVMFVSQKWKITISEPSF